MVLSRLLEPVQVQKGSAECETDETSHRRFAVVRCRSLAPITSGQPLVVRLSAALSTDIVNVASLTRVYGFLWKQILALASVTALRCLRTETRDE